MRKMKSLFKKIYTENHGVTVLNEVTEGCDWVLKGEGIATRKMDGTCCLIKDGKLYARFDFKSGRMLPEGAIPCQEKEDEVTGHFPHWVEVKDQPQYKWHRKAYEKQSGLDDGTYELIGKHFQNNVENVRETDVDIIVKHGSEVLILEERDFDSIKKYLRNNYIEGIVFHRCNGEMCKVKRVDFGYEWNGKTTKR